MIEPIYMDVSRKLEDYIAGHRITGRLPGMLKLSKELGVHHVTLAKAIRILENKGRLCVRGTRGTFVIPPQTGKRERFRTIAFIRRYYNFNDRHQLLEQLNRITQVQGYNTIGITLDEELLSGNPRLLLNFPVDGFLFTFSSLNARQAEQLRQERIPVVSCARMENHPWLDQVDCDHDTGYNLLLDRLLAYGHRRIAFLEHPRSADYAWYPELAAAIMRERQQRDFDPDLIYVRPDFFRLERLYGEKGLELYAEQAMRYWFSLPEPPTAIITSSMLFRKLHTLAVRAGMKIPEDLSLMAVCHYAQTAVNEDELINIVSGVFFNENEILSYGMNRLLKCLRGEKMEPGLHRIKPMVQEGETAGPVPLKRNASHMR